MDFTQTKRFVGDRIAVLRQRNRCSQRELCRMIDLDRVTLCRIENGIGNPTLETLQRIADGLGVEVADLFLHDDNR